MERHRKGSNTRNARNFDGVGGGLSTSASRALLSRDNFSRVSRLAMKLQITNYVGSGSISTRHAGSASIMRNSNGTFHVFGDFSIVASLACCVLGVVILQLFVCVW